MVFWLVAVHGTEVVHDPPQVLRLIVVVPGVMLAVGSGDTTTVKGTVMLADALEAVRV
jgi:hypothetical protein